MNTQALMKITACAVALGVAGSLAGCGTVDASGDASGDGLIHVKIGKAVDTVGHALVHIADEQGFFEEQGVEVEIVDLAGSAVTNSALQSGDIQFATAASLPFLIARQQNFDIISIASLDYGVPLQLVAAGEVAENIDESAPLEERMAQLEGATVGFVSATDNGFLDLLLARAGMTPDDVKRASFDSQSAFIAAMEAGQIDAGIGSPPTTVASVVNGAAVTVASAREIEKFADMTYDIVETTSTYAEENPEVVTAVATAIAQANNWVNDEANAEELLAFEVGHFSGVDEKALAASLEFVTFSENAYQTQAQWDNAVDIYVEKGLVEGEPTAVEGEAWTNEYIDLEGAN